MTPTDHWIMIPLAAVILVGTTILVQKLAKNYCKTPLMELASVLKAGETDAEVEKYKKAWEKKIEAVKARPTLEQELEMLDCSPTPRFAPDDPRMLAYLDEHGYAVVKDVAKTGDIERLHTFLWDFLELQTTEDRTKGKSCGWQRNDASTWTDEGMCHIGSCSVGILNGRGIGHSDFLWAARELPGVLATFQAIWKTSDLATSFDGGNIFRPYDWPEQRHEKVESSVSEPFGDHRRTQGGWWHVDQGPKKVGRRHAVQGLVSLFDSDETTGSLCVIPGSHRRHTELLRDVLGSNVDNPSDDARDFASVPPYFPGFNELPRRLVCCKAGDLVLWDSRTFHCNTPAPKPAAAAVKSANSCGVANRLLRAVAYVCMTPSSLLDDDEDGNASGDGAGVSPLRQQRRAAYEGRVTTSHWPHSLNFGMSGVDCAGQAPLDYNAASPLRRSLVG